MDKPIITKSDIHQRAKIRWDCKSPQERHSIALKYNHFARKIGIQINEWEQNFDLLSDLQRGILVKGELIRLYDSLPNLSKTKLMKELNLTTFASKWYKLPSCDKKKLLNYVTK